MGCRRGSDPALLWLWRRPGATAPIRPLAWEPPYAARVAQENGKKTRQNKKEKKRKKKEKDKYHLISCMWNLKYGTNEEPIHKTERDSQT